jgi:hypothetical protein
MTIFGREPALIAAAVAIAINLAIKFGLDLTVDQVVLINALVVAIMAIVVRQNVYSPATVARIVASPPALSGPVDAAIAAGVPSETIDAEVSKTGPRA